MSKNAKREADREAMLEKHILKISKTSSLAKLTPKKLRRKLEASLKLKQGKLDKMKAKIVEIALRHVAMPDDGEILSVQVLSVEKQLEKRKRAAEEAGSVIDVSAKKKSKPCESGIKPPSAAIKAFRNFIRAAHVTPSVFKGLTGLSDSAQTEALRDRLRDKGFTFKGEYPTKTEIKKARQKHEKEDDLDGMDTSAILPASHKRGRRDPPHKEEKSTSKVSKTKTNAGDSEEEFTL